MANAEDHLPPGVLVNCEVTVWQFIDPETAELKWVTHYQGDVPLSQALGLLELAKDDILANVHTLREESGNDED